MKLSLITKSVAALCVVAALTSTSHAAPITGSISFGVLSTLDSPSLNLATKVTAWDLAFAYAPSGDFASYVTNGDAVTLTAPWSFNSGALTPLWTINGFTFDLTSSSVSEQNANFLNVTGNGTISGNGFASTPGVWSFTISDADGEPNFGSLFAFAANNSAVNSAVPDSGTTVALFGFSMLGLHGIRRKLLKA